MNIRALAIPALAAFATSATAQVDLTVDPNQSSASAEICVDVDVFGQRCDTDNSAITGSIQIELDDYGNPVAISFYDFVLTLSSDLSYNFDWGFLVGGVDIDLTGATIAYATPGVQTGPVTVEPNGDFEFPAVSAIVSGNAAYDGYGLVLDGLVGSGSFNLADFGVIDSAIAGNVQVDGNGNITLSGFQAFANSGDFSGANVSIDGTATLVATGIAPDDCAADFNDDGAVNTQDVLAFLNAWSANDPASDCNEDSAINTQDVLCFLNAWSAGC